MTDCCGDTFLASVVKSNYTAVAERKLQFAYTLLTGYLTSDAAVNLFGQPVLSGNCLKAQHLFDVLVNIVYAISNVLVCTNDGFIAHNGLW